MALVCLLAIGLVAFAIDVGTIRITPDPSTFKTPTYAAFPGERLQVQLDGGWTPVRTTNPAVVSPLGDNWFVALAPGTATLSAASIRCPRCEIVTILWRANVRVGFAGT